MTSWSSSRRCGRPSATLARKRDVEAHAPGREHLVRAVLGARVRELIEQYGQDVALFAPGLAFAEAARHLPTINIKRGVDPGPLLDSLDPLRVVVDEVPPEVTDPEVMRQTVHDDPRRNRPRCPEGVIHEIAI